MGFLQKADFTFAAWLLLTHPDTRARPGLFLPVGGTGVVAFSANVRIPVTSCLPTSCFSGRLGCGCGPYRDGCALRVVALPLCRGISPSSWCYRWDSSASRVRLSAV